VRMGVGGNGSYSYEMESCFMGGLLLILLCAACDLMGWGGGGGC